VSGDAARLQRMVTSSARITFFAALPIAIAFTFLGGPILAIVFGTDFARGHASLAILCCAQLVSVAVGPVGPLLNMSGHERVTARSFAWSAAANVLLSALLIPALGMAGAAIATAITFAGWRLFLWRQVLSRVGIDSSVVRRIDRRDRR
jgi:O-antigen/teichoic acid export membrane protein